MENKLDEKKLLESQATMSEVSAASIFGELEKELPKKIVSEEEKALNPFQFKYEVSLCKLNKNLQSINGLHVGKKGRVIEVLDSKTVLVDFWDTKPAKVPVRSRFLDLVRTREQVELDSGIVSKTNASEDNTKTIPLKFDQGKPRLDLIRPEFTLGLGEALSYGATKYKEEVGKTPNYLKGEGLNYSKIIGSLERHIALWKMGVDIDEESGLHHLQLAAANLMFLYTYEKSNIGIDDRVKL